MAGAGYGVVGEFHYVHHQPDGTPYAEPNAMALAVAEAARAAGLPIVMLPPRITATGWDGADLPAARRPASLLRPRRRDVPGAGRGAARMGGRGRRRVDVGVAAHSVRAVPAPWLEAIAEYAERHGLVRHVHAHEQRRELDECRAEHGCSPIELLEQTGFLGPRDERDPRHPRRLPTTCELLRGVGDDRRLVPDDRGRTSATVCSPR